MNPPSAITEILYLNPKISFRPDLSIIIPVLHESGIINSALESLKKLPTRYSFEIIIVDGNPGADTCRHIMDQTVKCMIGQAGRGAQMNTGAEQASGHILLFLHADTRLPLHAMDRIISICRKTGFAGGAFDLGIDSPKPIFRIIERAASIRARITRIPYGDQAIFVKRSVFKSIGGYREIPIMEDIDLMRRIKQSGYRIQIIDDPVKTSSRRWNKEGIIYCTLRNTILSALYYCGVSPIRLKGFYAYEIPKQGA